VAKKAKRKLKAQRKEQATGKVDAQDRGRAAEVVEAPPAGRLRSFLMGEGGLYLLLIIIALVIRLWDLDVRAVHYDESAWHIKDSWLLYKGNGYAHTPVSHGPFQYFGTAFIFLIFGAGDFTARLLPALFGTALVGLPYFLRRPLGRVGAFVVALLLTFSPLFLYYSRYARNDIYSAFWALLLVVCIWRYFENRKARYLYIGAAALSLNFCTKEVSYITVGILGFFLLVIAGRELAGRVLQGFNFKDLSPQADVAAAFLRVCGAYSRPGRCSFFRLSSDEYDCVPDTAHSLHSYRSLVELATLADIRLRLLYHLRAPLHLFLHPVANGLLRRT